MNKKVVIVVSVIILASLGGFLWARQQSNTNDTKQNVSYDKPSKEQLQDSDSHKQEPANQNNQDDTSNTETLKKKVPIVITTYNTDNGQVSVNGYVDGIVESGGSCTLSLVDTSGKTVTSTRSAQPDASTTTCGRSIISGTKLHPGTWSATLSYTSDKYTGVSDKVSIEI